MDPNIAKGILIIFWGIFMGFFLGLTVKNYYILKIHTRAINKLIDELERIHIEKSARELAGKITDMIFGDDKPEDLEKAIKEAADEEGLDVDSIVIKGKKKPAKKTTKKAEKKEKK